MKTPDVTIYSYNQFGLNFYGYQNIWDSDESEYFYYSDTTGEKIYGGNYDDFHYFLDKTNVKYIDDINEYIAEHGQFTIPFKVTFMCDTDPSGNTYDLDWASGYNPSSWYLENNKYQATFYINANILSNNWKFNYPKEWKIKSLYEFHTEENSGSGGSGSGGGSAIALKTADFRNADDLSNVITTDYMFQNCSQLTGVNFNNSTFTNLESADYMFQNCELLTENSIVINNAVGFANLESAYYMFACNDEYTDKCICGNAVTDKILNLVGNGTFNTDIEYVYLRFTNNNIKYQVVFDYESNIVLNVVGTTQTLSGAINIPSSITKSTLTLYPWIINYGAFNEQDQITSVTIPSTVMGVGSGAFYGCSLLTSVNLPNNNNLNTVGYNAFCGCVKLKTINLENVIHIEGYAFYNCDIEILNLPSITYIGESAFYSCPVEQVTFGSSITTIQANAFNDCVDLVRATYSSIENLCGIDFGNSKSNPLHYAKHLYINGNQITNLTIPNTVTSIKSHAFVNCELITRVTIPSTVTQISTDAFFGCTGLTRADYSSIAHLCGINFATMYSNPLYYANNLYVNDTLVTNVVIPNTVTTINKYAFANFKSMVSVDIPSTTKATTDYLFMGCDNLVTISRPIGFDEKLDTNTNVRSGRVYYFGNYNSMFEGCKKLTTFSDILTTGSKTGIQPDFSHMFKDCEELTGDIVLPVIFESNRGLEWKVYTSYWYGKIEMNGMFENCKKITSVNIQHNTDYLSVGDLRRMFYNCIAITSVMLDIKALSAWVPDDNRYEYTEATATSAFENCGQLQTIQVDTGMYISDATNMFKNCNSLTTIMGLIFVNSVSLVDCPLLDLTNFYTHLKKYTRETDKPRITMNYTGFYSLSNIMQQQLISGIEDKGWTYLISNPQP